MAMQQNPNFHHVLLLRGVSSKALAEAIGRTEGHVSKIRNGLRPGKATRDAIVAELSLTEHEVAALGWTDVRAGVGSNV